jgi:hypothetical protein
VQNGSAEPLEVRCYFDSIEFQALGRDDRQVGRKTQGMLSPLNLSGLLGAFGHTDGPDSCKEAWVKTFLGQPRKDTFWKLEFRDARTGLAVEQRNYKSPCGSPRKPVGDLTRPKECQAAAGQAVVEASTSSIRM